MGRRAYSTGAGELSAELSQLPSPSLAYKATFEAQDCKARGSGQGEVTRKIFLN